MSDWICKNFAWLIGFLDSIGFWGQVILAVSILLAAVFACIISATRDYEFAEDDDAFDARWMDYEAWLDTRPGRR